MIHLRRTSIDATMLAMTFDATAHVGMKSGRLPFKQRTVVGMADDAVGRFYAFCRCVAGRAVVP